VVGTERRRHLAPNGAGTDTGTRHMLYTTSTKRFCRRRTLLSRRRARAILAPPTTGRVRMEPALRPIVSREIDSRLAFHPLLGVEQVIRRQGSRAKHAYEEWYVSPALRRETRAAGRVRRTLRMFNNTGVRT
jgi:hypothetical protein